MSESKSIYSDLKQLGQHVKPPESPEEAMLETVSNPHPDVDFCVRFTAPEFTSLCPLTGQPDFAHLVLDYVPDALMVESKSLKMYLGSFRNHGAFHEPAPWVSHSGWWLNSAQSGCDLEGTGIRVVVSRLMCFPVG